MPRTATPSYRAVALFLLLAALLALTLRAPVARAAGPPIGLDPTFGQGGLARTEVGNSTDAVAGVAALPDGSVLVAGTYTPDDDYDIYSYRRTGSDFALARYRPDGSLDPSFGAGGRVITNFFTYEGYGLSDRASAMALQPDGKILLAGQVEVADDDLIRYGSSFGIARYLPDGALDPSFGVGGKASIYLQGRAGYLNGKTSPSALALQPDGAILLAGYESNDLVLLRLTPDGARDLGFGVAGITQIPLPSSYEATQSIALAADGMIWLAGNIRAGGQDDLLVARLSGAGLLDAGFGTAGMVTLDLAGATDTVSAVLPQPDGRLLLVGTSGAGTSASALALVRLLPDGRPDPDMGPAGVTLTSRPGLALAATAAQAAPGGALLVSGTATGAAGSDLLLARFGPDGALDPSFGDGGLVLTDVHGQDQAGAALARAADGAIFAAGTSLRFGVPDLLLARYDASGALDPTFGAGGLRTADLVQVPEGTALVLPRPDGRIVRVFMAQSGASPSDLFLGRALADGSPDLSFGERGLVAVSQDLDRSTSVIIDAPAVEYAQEPLFLADGRIVLAVTIVDVNGPDGGGVEGALLCYLPDGRLDPSFGNAGVIGVFADLGVRADQLVQAALLDDDRIILLRDSGEDDSFLLNRYTPNGQPDPTFGVNGAVTDYISDNDNDAVGMATQPDGSLVVSGGANGDLILVRYRPDGSRDPGFGVDGQAQQDLGANDLGQAIFILPSGQLLVLVQSEGYDQELRRDMYSYALARFNPDGTLDPSFGTGGILPIAPGASASPTIVPLPSGKLLALFSTASGPDPQGPLTYHLARFRANGRPDLSFGAGGTLPLALGDQPQLRASDIGPSGMRLLFTRGPLSGNPPPPPPELLMLQLQPNGRPDPRVGANGVLELGQSPMSSTGVARFTPTGFLLAGNHTGAIVLARYGPLPAPFPSTALLASFQRRNGRLTRPWIGPGLPGYRVADQMLDVDGGGPLYWQPRFGDTQEIYATLTAIDPAGRHGLLLKVENKRDVVDWRAGAIRVTYDAAQHTVQVATNQPRKGWQLVRSIAATLQAGDQFGARADRNGTVLVYRNGQLLGIADTTTTNGSFFAQGRRGRVGLWFEQAPAALVDDIGGGTIR